MDQQRNHHEDNAAEEQPKIQIQHTLSRPEQRWPIEYSEPKSGLDLVAQSAASRKQAQFYDTELVALINVSSGEFEAT